MSGSLARDYPENVINEHINKVDFGKKQPSRRILKMVFFLQ